MSLGHVWIDWIQISTNDCWGNCGGGLCEEFCGSGGYCCRKGYGDCPSEAGDASPSQHTCVKNRGKIYSLKTAIYFHFKLFHLRKLF